MIFVATAFADEPAAPVETRAADVRPADEGAKGGLTFLGLVGVRATGTNVTTTNPLVNGQLIGTLGGSNSTTTGETTGAWTEARAGAFFSYAPKLLDGNVSLDAAFEIDFAFGDTSYGIGGNTGGGIGADQVNLQTRRLAVRWDAFPKQRFVLGMQFVGDGVNDPGRARPDDLFRSGGKLLFFGTEMAGLTWYGRLDRAGGELVRSRVGFYSLWEQSFTDPDDVFLFVADAQIAPAYAWRVGAHFWWLGDRAGGAAGILGSGPSSALSEMQGGPRLDYRKNETQSLPELSADVSWVAVDAGYNAGLDKGRVGATVLGAVNLGRLYITDQTDASIGGALVDAELRARIAAGEGSIARAEVLYSTADDPSTRDYEGVLTANSYGIASTAWGTHGCVLLFPDTGAINRQSALAYDVSGAGEGLIAASGSVGFDPIPSRLNLTGVVGHAQTTAGTPLGTELGAKLSGRPFVLGTLGVAGAYVMGSSLPEDPYTVFVTFDWVVPG